MLPATLANEAYRRVELDARIEAARAEDLSRICIEEAVGALDQALIALKRTPASVPSQALSRAHTIALYLGRSVGADHPLRAALLQFYGGLAATLAHNLARPSYGEIAQVRRDFSDLLEAAAAA
ncbi:hypothetical protein [Erythrobacter sp.]|jgi:hypothetical protein|uniref:hypothetical protein n=1 Tax=Erythrobacter sp. TaxID=1042 RepID=UPI002E9B87EA|nr:hypothetical protein [Erythrobacter sp.]